MSSPQSLPTERPQTAYYALRTVLEALDAYLRIRPGQDSTAALADLVDAWEQWQAIRRE